MTPLRAKMITDMQLHRLAPGTQALYLREVANLEPIPIGSLMVSSGQTCFPHRSLNDA
jgi:hypothetical protein